MEWNLLEKTTFQVEGIELDGVDLGQVAGAAAAALGLESNQVLVVDVRPGRVAFDVLKRHLDAFDIAGKKKELLANLERVPGVRLACKPEVHSEGILGLIALDRENAIRVLADSSRLADEVAQAISRRAIVFASGTEVKEGKIRDTNSPYIMDALEKEGYNVKFGGVLDDDLQAVVINLENAIGQGFGLVITTGGVGAEDKDFNVEAVCRLDPESSTPWIMKFKKDFCRHHKEGVRIAVGKVGATRLVALPGPHEEAKIACARLLEGIGSGLDGDGLATYIVDALRQRWWRMMTAD